MFTSHLQKSIMSQVNVSPKKGGEIRTILGKAPKWSRSSDEVIA